MKNWKFGLIVYFISFSSALFCQTVNLENASVFLKNGKKLNGGVSMGLKKLKIRINSNVTKTYEGKDIDSIIVNFEDKKKKFVYNPLKKLRNKLKKYRLMEVIFEGKKIKLFKHLQSVRQNTGIGFYNDNGRITSFFVIRKNEKVSTRIESSYGLHKGFPKIAPKYFNDCKELLLKIKNKEFKRDDIFDVILFYEFKCK